MEDSKYLPYANLFLRLILAVTLLSAVADKLGLWGEPGANNVTWGSWFAYKEYMHQLSPYLTKGLADKLALGVTVLEAVLALMLIFGIKVRWAAVGTGVLSLMLALVMSASDGIKVALDHAVFVVSASSFLLAATPVYKWTLGGIKKRSVYRPY